MSENTENLRQRINNKNGEEKTATSSKNGTLDACQTYQRETDKMVRLCLLSVTAVIIVMFVIFILYITSDEGGLAGFVFSS